MKAIVLVGCLCLNLLGCAEQAVSIRPAAVTVVRPAYPSPGVGYVWAMHPRFGWGWRHPVYGWHQGWR